MIAPNILVSAEIDTQRSAIDLLSPRRTPPDATVPPLLAVMRLRTLIREHLFLRRLGSHRRNDANH